MRIDWDPAKAAANLQAHGVSFGEAATVLEDNGHLRVKIRTRKASSVLSRWG
jgi:uncharacterized DUF497 family protein